tara:strand:- start:26000 stop:26134 length:135 start_codon:yes stop_codon:yes gene_type:complete
MKKLFIFRESGGETGAEKGIKVSNVMLVPQIFTLIIKKTQLNVY